MILLRRADPGRPRPFRTPWVPALPMISVLLSVWLTTTLDLATWARFLGWMVLGLAVSFLFSRRRSRLAGHVGG